MNLQQLCCLLGDLIALLPHWLVFVRLISSGFILEFLSTCLTYHAFLYCNLESDILFQERIRASKDLTEAKGVTEDDERKRSVLILYCSFYIAVPYLFIPFQF